MKLQQRKKVILKRIWISDEFETPASWSRVLRQISEGDRSEAGEGQALPDRALRTQPPLRV